MPRKRTSEAADASEPRRSSRNAASVAADSHTKEPQKPAVKKSKTEADGNISPKPVTEENQEKKEKEETVETVETAKGHSEGADKDVSANSKVKSIGKSQESQRVGDKDTEPEETATPVKKTSQGKRLNVGDRLPDISLKDDSEKSSTLR